LLLGTVAQGVIGWRDAVHRSEASLVRAVQAGNVYAAQGVANTVLLQLHKLSQVVRHASESDELRALLVAPGRPGLNEFLQKTQDEADKVKTRLVRNGEENPIESWVVMDPDGTILARSPSSAVVGRNYRWRDYFQGAMRQAEKDPEEPEYISRVF